jgi:hypothetical protein
MNYRQIEFDNEETWEVKYNANRVPELEAENKRLLKKIETLEKELHFYKHRSI